MPQGRRILWGAASAVGLLWLIIAVSASNSFLVAGALLYGFALLVFVAADLRAGIRRVSRYSSTIPSIAPISCFSFEDVRPEVAQRLQPFRRRQDREVRRIDVPQLVPAQRHRDRRPRARTRRVDRSQRLPPGVLVVVEEDLPRPLLNRPLHRYVPWMRAHQELPDRLRRRPDRCVVETAAGSARRCAAPSCPSSSRTRTATASPGAPSATAPRRTSSRTPSGSAPAPSPCLLLPGVDVRVEVEHDEVRVVQQRPLDVSPRSRVNVVGSCAPSGSGFTREYHVCSSMSASCPSQRSVGRLLQMEVLAVPLVVALTTGRTVSTNAGSFASQCFW